MEIELTVKVKLEDVLMIAKKDGHLHVAFLPPQAASMSGVMSDPSGAEYDKLIELLANQPS